MKRNILLTGAHRSGSTWVGNVIAKAENVRYVHEPFNLAMNYKSSPLTHWFEYLSNSSISHQKKAKHYLNSFYSITNIAAPNEIKRLRLISKAYYFLIQAKTRLLNRTLIKDPIAIMSAEWVYKNLAFDVVILIRHPAAFVASLKVKNWEFDFNEFLNQENLMEDCLFPYSKAINEYAHNKKSIIEQGALLWNIIYATVNNYKKKFKDEWLFVKHEDLSLYPLQEFKKIFKFLKLNYSDKVEKCISDTTTAKETMELSRMSNENIKTWKKRLTADEIQFIKIETKDVWVDFYSENDWK